MATRVQVVMDRLERERFRRRAAEEGLSHALTLADACIPIVWAIEAEDVRAARTLAGRHSSLGARDLLHLACCVRHGAR